MRSTILYIAMSLDGYIADTNGSVDWLAGDGSAPDTNAEDAAFFQSIDTIILGRRTYDQITTELSPEAWPYEPFMTYVITHRPLPLRQTSISQMNRRRRSCAGCAASQEKASGSAAAQRSSSRFCATD